MNSGTRLSSLTTMSYPGQLLGFSLQSTKDKILVCVYDACNPNKNPTNLSHTTTPSLHVSMSPALLHRPTDRGGILTSPPTPSYHLPPSHTPSSPPPIPLHRHVHHFTSITSGQYPPTHLNWSWSLPTKVAVWHCPQT